MINFPMFRRLNLAHSQFNAWRVAVSEPGTFEFAKPSLLFKESAGKALIPIERSNGADGKVSVGWRTEDMSAHSPHDYEGGEGTIEFEHGEMTKMLEIKIHDDQVRLLSLSQLTKQSLGFTFESYSKIPVRAFWKKPHQQPAAMFAHTVVKILVRLFRIVRKPYCVDG